MKFLRELQKELGNIELYTDSVTRSIYSQDASIYQITPEAVVIPRTVNEVQKIVQLASRNKMKLTPRGAGTNTTGACISSGLILDLSKHLRSIRSFDKQTARIVVEPGIVQNELNREVSKFGLRLGPDTSTGDRATIGGMVGCNAAGAHSLHFGSMRNAVIRLELTLASGETLWLKVTPENEYASHPLFQGLAQIGKKYKSDIENNFPKFERNASGYALNELIQPNAIDFAKFVVGSEGTLGIITAVELQLVKQLPPTELLVLSFENSLSAIEAASGLLQLDPLALELIDHTILSAALEQHYPFPPGVDPSSGALLIAEFEKTPLSRGTILRSQEDCQALWNIRKGGLGLLLSRRSKRRAIGFIEDMAVPPQQLHAFYKELMTLFTQNEIQAGIYGHVGAGCLHIRPFFNLTQDRKRIEEIAVSALTLVKKYRGVFSSEHGDGLLRSWATEDFFGTRLFEAMKEVKALFDPHGIMNPGKIIPNQQLLDNVRQSPTTLPFEPVYRSHRNGGLELTVDLCNGNGACRKNSGTMCPSYQVTFEERQTTRARALALKGVLTGEIPKDELTSDAFADVFDLCISCKGCAHECPSHIDVSKIKSELLNFKNQKQGATLQSRFFSSIGSFLRLGSLFPTTSNWLASSIFGRLGCKLLGITHEHLPEIAKERFSTWAAREQLLSTSNPDVLLFSDTFTEFLDPEIGIATVKILKACGLKVQVLPWICCGRSAVSKGFLQQAKQQLKKLHSLIEANACPIIVLEPSCLSVFFDEGPELGLDFASKNRIYSLEDFLQIHLRALTPLLNRCPLVLYFHAHCHQKSLFNLTPIHTLLKAIPDARLVPLESGCCGMAGSFGYELQHVELSKMIFDRDLGNKLQMCDIRDSATHWIVTNGTSCRAQIRRYSPDVLKAKVVHVAQLFAELIKGPE